MRSFKSLITEQKETIVFTFGRFNPPTTGHEKLIAKVASVAGSNPYRIYPSHTTNPKKDPLPHALKVAYMRKIFKKYSRNIIADKKMKTAIFIAEALYKEGFKNLIMVVGSDRVEEFSTLLNRYNDAPDLKGKQVFKFDSIKVISAGERDPDSEGVEGMSASKMRAAAADGDKDAFLTGLPSGFKNGEKLYRDVRKYMGIREDRNMGDMSDFETVRDMYLTGKIWNAGDIIEANGVTGEVIRKGTNYLSFVDEDGKIHKVWLHEITLDEAKSSLQKLKDFDKSRVAAGKSPIFKDKPAPKFVRMKKSGQMTIMNVPTDEIDKYEKKGYKIVEDLELDERNYASEYANYQGKPEQIARRSSRNKARRIMGDKTKIGMDVGHKDNNPMNNDPKNLKNEVPSANRKEPRLRERTQLPWLNQLTDYLFKKTHPKGLNKLALQVAKEYEKQKDTGKIPNISRIVNDIAKSYEGVSSKLLIDYIRDLEKQGKVPKELVAEYVPEGKLPAHLSKFFDKKGNLKPDAAKRVQKSKNKSKIKDVTPKGYGPNEGLQTFTDFVKQMQTNEVLSKDADAGEYIKDFKKSDAPQFKGKSEKKKKQMAVAAYYSNKK